MADHSALDLRFMCHDLNREVSIRGYMRALLTRLFAEGESFSGKRPFGNSGWEYDIITPLVKAGFVDGELDEEGCVNRYDKPKYERVLAALIAAL